jgi:type VI secretion system protein ImpA
MNLDELLLPISETQIAGTDLSFSIEFDRIQDARRTDDPTLDQGEWITELKEANWPLVAEECGRLLRISSKDLRLAVWLTEAWGKIHGFQGLAWGYELIARLCEQYWDYLHPLPEHDDMEQRIGNLTWLVLRSAEVMTEIPLTSCQGQNYSFRDHESARHHAHQLEKNPSQADTLKKPAVTLSEFDHAHHSSPREFYVKIMPDLNQCAQALAHCDQTIDRRLALQGPSFSRAKEALSKVTALAERLSRDAGAFGTHNPIDTMPTAPVEATPSTVGIASLSGTLNNRAQALEQLRQVADFFKRTEPHSPVAYLAEKAAKWGEMPLHDWLRTVIKDPSALSQLEELLGLNTQKESGT